MVWAAPAGPRRLYSWGDLVEGRRRPPDSYDRRPALPPGLDRPGVVEEGGASDPGRDVVADDAALVVERHDDPVGRLAPVDGPRESPCSRTLELAALGPCLLRRQVREAVHVGRLPEPVGQFRDHRVCMDVPPFLAGTDVDEQADGPQE